DGNWVAIDGRLPAREIRIGKHEKSGGGRRNLDLDFLGIVANEAHAASVSRCRSAQETGSGRRFDQRDAVRVICPFSQPPQDRFGVADLDTRYVPGAWQRRLVEKN